MITKSYKPRIPFYVMLIIAILYGGGLFLIGVTGMLIEHIQVTQPE